MTAKPKLFRYKLFCPGCKRDSEHVAERFPDVKCGDCLMDRVEVVTMQVTDVSAVRGDQ